MFGRIYDFIRKHLIADVPDELAACLDCDAVQCLNEKWETCPNRLARLAALSAARADAAAIPCEPPVRAAEPSTEPSPG